MRSGPRLLTVVLCAMAVLVGVAGRSARAADTYRTGGVWNGVKWEGEFQVERNGQLRGTIALPENPGLGVLPAVGQIESDRVVVRVLHGDKQVMEFSGLSDGASVSGLDQCDDATGRLQTTAELQRPPPMRGR